MSVGEEIGFVVRDASTWTVDVDDARGTMQKFDVSYYSRLLEKAWKEIAFAFEDL